MCDVNLELKEYFWYEKLRNVLYMLLIKALYGWMKYTILCYDVYKNILKGVNFKLILYEKSVSNNMVNGEHFTLCWYVDYNKVSHMDDTVN